MGSVSVVRLVADVGATPRSDPAFAEPFAKSPADEELLERLNAALAPVEEAEYVVDLDEKYPTLHVIGVPRSGTTLLYQLIAAGLEIGYVDNLTAAFWRAPVYGLRLSRKLGLRRLAPSFDSAFGRTKGVGEPHEFGYFWNYHLRYPGLSALPDGHEEAIDWPRLRTVLVNMAHWNGGPIAFKPMLLTWHLERMHQEMPGTCYVWVRRDPRETALSLLSMRRSLFGSYEAWASLRPFGPEWLADEPPWRQVAAQVVVLDRTIEAAAGNIGSDSLITVDYTRLCAAPGAVLEQIRALLGAKGDVPDVRTTPLRAFEPRRQSELEAEFGDLVGEALTHYSRMSAAPQ